MSALNTVFSPYVMVDVMAGDKGTGEAKRQRGNAQRYS
jgi:hypothetical protein